MKDTIKEISLIKNSQVMYPGDISIYARGIGGFDDGLYMSELEIGSNRSFIIGTGMTRDEADWLCSKARELYRDKKNNCIDINLITKKIHKYYCCVG